MTAIDDAQAVLDKLSWYSRQLLAIHRDESLTAAGRERQYFNMAQSFELYGKTAYNGFEAAWRKLKSELASLDSRRRAASQRFDDSWSFERLQYYKAQAITDIGRFYSMQECEKHIRSVVATGSKEQVRAYLESSTAVLNRFRGQVGVGGLVKWMDDEAARLTRPPEFDKYDEQESELISQVVKLRDMTVSAANMIPQAGIGNLLRLVQIGMRADSVSGKYFYSVVFTDDEPLIAPVDASRPTVSGVAP